MDAPFLVSLFYLTDAGSICTVHADVSSAPVEEEPPQLAEEKAERHTREQGEHRGDQRCGEASRLRENIERADVEKHDNTEERIPRHGVPQLAAQAETLPHPPE